MRQLAPDRRTDCVQCHGIGSFPTGPAEVNGTYLAHQSIVACHCSGGDEVWGGNVHPLALAEVDGYVAWVDEGIKDDIESLWQHGIQTWVSCQGGGHARYVSLHEPTPKHIEIARTLLPWAVTEVPGLYPAHPQYSFYGRKIAALSAGRTRP